MNYAEIKELDIANGEGVRVSLFVSGCSHHCKGCFNPETWDFAYGKPFDESVIARIIKLLSPNYVTGLSLLGGEPFHPANQPSLLELVKRVRAIYPEKTIWSYTGYIYDRDLIKGGKAHCAATDEFLKHIDVLVDGPFIENCKNISLRFRGSENQRIIDVPASLREGKTVLWNPKEIVISPRTNLY